MATQLTKNFSLEEFVRSETATRYNIDNTPDASAKAHLQELANALQSIRDFYGKGIKINSGYRCPKLNSHPNVGGSTTSQHMTGYAADIKPVDGNMAALKSIILAWAKTHDYDQIIMEQCDSNGIPRWIHFGCKHTIKGCRKQQLKASKIGGKWVYASL